MELQITTQPRTMGTEYRIENLIAELVDMKNNGVIRIDLMLQDNGYFEFNEYDDEEWVEDVEYLLKGSL